MTAQNATSEYIEFLCQRGSISHVVSSPPGASISTLALTQRCLASGVDFPVPLPDGTVGINITGDVPPALAALDLVIEAVPGAQQDESAETEVAADDEASEEQSATGQVDGAAFETSDMDAGSPSTPDEFADEAVADADHPPQEDQSDVSATAESQDASDVAEDGVPMFMRSGGQSQQREVCADGELAPEPISEASPDNDSDEDRPYTGEDMASEPVTQEIEADWTEEDAADDASVADHPAAEASVSTGAASNDMLEAISRVESALGKFGAEQAELKTRFDAFEKLMDDHATRPVPRPDATEFNLGMARMTAAFAHVMRRIDTLLDAMPDGDGAQTADMSEPLATGLSAIAAAVRAAGAGKGPAASELTVIASMQETMSHQLAKLIESSRASKVPEMEEFLQDLRHATAELLAEQTRLAKAG